MRWWEPCSSVKDRREVGAGRLVIEPDCHQCRLVHEAEAVLQAPAKQLAVARRHQKAAARKGQRGTDQRLQTLVGLAYGVPKKCDVRGIGGDRPEMLADAPRPLPARSSKQ